jgi:hypothetical protein
MTRRICPKPLPLLAATAVLGTLVSAAGNHEENEAPTCATGPRLCYDAPTNAGPGINTARFEGGPALSHDGLTLLFGAARTNSLGQLDEDLYVATRATTAEPFGQAKSLGPSINSLGFGDYSPELSLDGLTLYFSSSRPGGLGEADLYVATRESIDDPWDSPQNLGPNVNTEHFEGQPSISANGKTLYWDSNRPDGLGDFDIWMATRRSVESSFGPAANAGPEINGPGPEFGAAISQNEKQLFFSSARPGNVGQIDIWVVERRTKRHSWGTPTNVDTLNSPFFQAMPTFGRNGRDVCFMAFRPEGFGGLDIWCANRLQ